MHPHSKVLVLGATGLVGSSLVRYLKEQGYTRLLTPNRNECDLLSQEKTLQYFDKNRPEFIFMAAAKVGGILANNTYRADFILDNLSMEVNLFGAIKQYRPKKLCFFGSSCIYPRLCPQPMKEEFLLSGPLEPTNEPYAIAKISGIKLCESFREQYGINCFSVMPPNLYGPNDHFDDKNSHVLQGLMYRMERAKRRDEKVFPIWGTGKALREFLYVDDLAEISVELMNKEQELPSLINIGPGEEVSINTLANLVQNIVGLKADLVHDSRYPDGMPRKRMDTSYLQKLNLKPKVSLQEGLSRTYEYFLNHVKIEDIYDRPLEDRR